ncbi:MAG: DUF308 domain-containing protein [Pseudomonadota bacterium]
MQSDTAQGRPEALLGLDRGVWLLIALAAWLYVLGMLAFFFPLPSHSAVALLAGVGMAGGGVLQLLYAIAGPDGSFRPWSLLSAILSLLGAVLIFANPLWGADALMLLIAALLLAGGTLRVMMAWLGRSEACWREIGFSGLVSIVMSGGLYLYAPDVAPTNLAMLLGFSFLSEGMAYSSCAIGRTSGASGVART